MILSNLGNQLNFLRTLAGLSALTGRARYRERALEICRHALRHGRRRGMLLWGNHAAVDLCSRRPVFLAVKGKVHELKSHYPPYDLLREAAPEAFDEMVAACWRAHVYDWARLDFSRHGRMDLPDSPLPPAPWGAHYVGGDIFFIGGGLTFINAGSDLYYAAASLSRLSNRPAPLTWARRLMGRYEETRHPRTGMSGYTFSSIFDKSDPERKRSGDRALKQFREQFPEHDPKEGTLTTTGALRAIAATSALCRLRLARDLGAPAGAAFGHSAAADQLAYGKWAYDSADSTFHPVFTDGFRLTGQRIAQSGYYGPAGQVFAPRSGDGLFFWAYAAGWRFCRDEALWTIARNIGLHAGLGEIGARPGERPRLTPPPGPDSPAWCFGLLELDEEFPGAGFLPAATDLAQRIIAERFHEGLFAAKDAPVVGADAIEAVALLHVAARLTGRTEAAPVFCSSSPLTPLSGWTREGDAGV